MPERLVKTKTQIRVKGAEPVRIRTEAALDDVLGALANERRRQILAEIRETTDAMSVSTLAERVADRLASVRSEPGSNMGVRRLRVALHHQHLPKMAAAGLVKYDAGSRTVRKTDAVHF